MNSSSDNTQAIKIQLERDAFDQLVYIDERGTRHIDVQPIRLFPYSDPLHWISLCTAQRKELLCISDLTQLPAEITNLLEEELARREFVPVLLRIISVSSDTEPSEWEVETDRGCTRFVLKSEEDVRRLGHKKAIILDAHGVRYLIPNMSKLDSASLHILEQYV